ncbi:hypothetical protein RW1_036_00320 [Rhodococcus wratislaviensis NBRC 100605]|uniref:Uncharacterized protein n=1 Tax=Rhodococcus wratislaviensis NBRC 100605 TaxID=1219028 RepID=X0Q6N6_RHOWR|nr:hypothetical protein RW1_036_00320 [Rhodococcus wratislaviensis NBRC 100605]
MASMVCLQARADSSFPRLDRLLLGQAAFICGAHQVVEVRSFCVIELQGSADAVEDALGVAGAVTPFEANVVFRAHTGEQGYLLAA